MTDSCGNRTCIVLVVGIHVVQSEAIYLEVLLLSSNLGPCVPSWQIQGDREVQDGVLFLLPPCGSCYVHGESGGPALAEGWGSRVL